jgi:hypothetical protein
MNEPRPFIEMIMLIEVGEVIKVKQSLIYKKGTSTIM